MSVPTQTIVLRIPHLSLDLAAKSFRSHFSGLVLWAIDGLKNLRSKIGARTSANGFRNPDRGRKIKKFLPLLILLSAVGLAVVGIGRGLSRLGSPSSTTRVSVAGAKAASQLNREFNFPLTDTKGQPITEMKFTLENAELRDEIIVNGKRAIAIEGRTFLILTFKITSTYSRALEINTKNYFRLTRNGNSSDLLAADIHNDPVIVQPTSTKFTRIGWPINDSDTGLTLLVGDIEGEKTSVELNLQ